MGRRVIAREAAFGGRQLRARAPGGGTPECHLTTWSKGECTGDPAWVGPVRVARREGTEPAAG